MRFAALAIASFAFAASASAAFEFTTQRSTVASPTGFERITFFVLSDRDPTAAFNSTTGLGGGQLIASELYVSSVGQSMRFAAPIDTDADMLGPNDVNDEPTNLPDAVPIVTSQVGLLSASTTRFSTQIFQLIAPQNPLPSNQLGNNFTSNPFASGLSLLQIIGFDGRSDFSVTTPSTPNSGPRGTDASASVNGGRGAALASLVVPAGTSVRFRGFIGDESTAVAAFDVINVIPEPTTLVAVAAVGVAGLARRRRA